MYVFLLPVLRRDVRCLYYPFISLPGGRSLSRVGCEGFSEPKFVVVLAEYGNGSYTVNIGTGQSCTFVHTMEIQIRVVFFTLVMFYGYEIPTGILRLFRGRSNVRAVLVISLLGCCAFGDLLFERCPFGLISVRGHNRYVVSIARTRGWLYDARVPDLSGCGRCFQ